MKATRIRGQFTIRDTDPLVNSHRVQDIHILPGMALLDAVYKTLEAQRMDVSALALRSILFHEPVVTNAQIDRRLSVTVDRKGAEGRITVTSVPWKADRDLASDSTTHMTCLLAQTVVSTPGVICAEPLPAEAIDLDICYAVTRHIGIFHEGFMKCSGRVAQLPSGQHLGEVSLGPDASARAAEFLLHPVLLDCATIVPLFQLHDQLEQASLFMPFAVDEFHAAPFRGSRQVRVLVEPLATDTGGGEVLRYSLGIFDLQGRQLAAVQHFKVKKVRSLGKIRGLLEMRLTLHSVPAPALTPTPANVAVAATGDPIRDLIGEIVGQQGKFAWNPADARKSFFDLGLDSLALLEAAEALEKRLGVRLCPTALFENPDVTALAAYLRRTFPEACAAYANATSPEAPPTDSPVAPPSAPPPEVFVPRWLPVRPDVAPSSAQAIALLGAGEDIGVKMRLQAELGSRVCFRGGAAEFRSALNAGLRCDEVCLVAVDHDFAFAVAKALIQANRLGAPLTLRAITLDCFRVHEESPREGAPHGVWGLLQSLSREYPLVRVIQVDLLSGEVMGEGGDWISPALAAAPTRTLRAIREGRIYRRTLLPTRPAKPGTPVFRRGGSYLVVGGASGVGLELVRYLRRNYSAKVAVIGRRPESGEILRTLAVEGEYGRDVLYLSAAVDDEPAFTQAVQIAQAQLGELHGVVHSAMVLEDCRLAEMDEAAFARVLRPKVAGALALARSTAGLKLDFVLFFSSAQSFVGNMCQANYAAASTFLDGFAGAMRVRRAYPVAVVNWGYWSEVGAVASEPYRQLMTRQGVYGLKSGEALAALEEVLAVGWQQAAIVSAEESVLEEMGLDRGLCVERSPSRLRMLPGPPVSAVSPDNAQTFAETEAAMARLLDVTRQRVGQIVSELLAGKSVDEAVDSGVLASQHARLVRVLLALTDGNGGLNDAKFAAAIARIHDQVPVLRPFLPLLEAAISAYPSVLTGKASAAAALFPGGSVDLVGPVYGQSAVSRFYNERVAQAVLFLARQNPRPLRIVEIGAGTGSTTIEVLDALARQGVECDYCYTDLWDKLVNEAKARLGREYPKLRFAFFDVGIDPTDQGLREEFDVVIATNVLHATPDLHKSLRHAKRLLRPGGSLILNESVEAQEYCTYTFGLLPGWWNASDPHERLADSPLASASRWPALLRDEGFVQVRELVPADSAVRAQQVYLAFSDGESRSAIGKKATDSAPAAHGLPVALSGKLRPFAPLAFPRAKRVETFQDDHDNIWVFLNNPPANMFTGEVLGELCATLQSVATLPAAKGRLVYLSHFGEYFSLGGDRSELVRTVGDADMVAAFAEKARALIRVITSLDAPVVAVVNGTAQGGGFETLLATDLQVVRNGVRLGLPEIKSGLIPGMGGLTYLQDLIGRARTKRLALLGDLIEAAEAHAWGLISHVAADPFAAALALGDGLKNIEAALYMKRILRRDTAERLTADIDDWTAYITRHSEWIDTRRISNSKLVLSARVAALAN